MKIKHKYITVFSIITIVLLVGIAATFAIGFGSPTSLSETRIIELRERFPIHSDKSALAESGYAPLDMTIKALANAYVMVDVVEQLPDYTYSAIPSKGSDLDEILTKQGLSSLDVTCIERSVKIIDIFYQGDSGVKLNPDLSVEIGQIITVSMQSKKNDSVPDLALGSRYVMPLLIRSTNTSGYDYTYSPKGLYYVVDNNYVLSSFDVNGEASEFDGLTINGFKETIINIRNTPSKWDITPYPLGTRSER